VALISPLLTVYLAHTASAQADFTPRLAISNGKITWVYTRKWQFI